MNHVDEELLAAFAAGLVTESEHDALAGHLEECADCGGLVDEYRETVAALRAWQPAPDDAIEAAMHAIAQRARLYRLLGRLAADVALRRHAAEDPKGVLVAHGLTPTPRLLAAFKELDVSGLERFPGALDERVVKLLRGLE